MVGKRRILIVNGTEESREILRTALQLRGLEILEANAPADGLAMAQRHHPRVIVLDLEGDRADDEAVCDRFTAQSQDDQSSLLVLGNQRFCRAAQRRPPIGPPTETGDRFVAKPYHYAPLIRKIEELAG
ncbi:MAG: hypothetical protein K8T25_14225 [Planctomycetia bacterium]|nr:hypothetical protein [Planctomycetia bacterium]